MKLPSGCVRNARGVVFCKINDRDVEMKFCEWHLGHGSACRESNGAVHSFPDVIFPILLDEDRKMAVKSHGIIRIGGKTKVYPKDLYLVGRIGDLGNVGDDSIIVSMYATEMIVRKIKVKDDVVELSAADGNDPLRLPKDLDVYYEPWNLDRGSFVFINPSGNYMPKGQQLKLATEGDIMKEK